MTPPRCRLHVLVTLPLLCAGDAARVPITRMQMLSRPTSCSALVVRASNSELYQLTWADRWGLPARQKRKLRRSHTGMKEASGLG